MLGVVSDALSPPPPGSSHSSGLILGGDRPPRGPPRGPPGSPVEKDEKTLWKLLIAFINKPVGQINPVQLKAPE